MAAATDTGVEAFLARMRNQGGIVVRETPRFDLYSYIQGYNGSTRYDRLLLIGQCSAPLCGEALRAALDEAKKGVDVERYRTCWDYLHTVAPNSPEAVLDRQWIELTEASNKSELKRIETELKMYKNNLVKESIRMGHEELGLYLESTGNLASASDAYNRMRPDLSTPKHIVDMSKHLVSVAVKRREWSYALAHINKIVGLQGIGDESQTQPYVRAMTGLAYMGLGKYALAAKSFLEIDMKAGSKGVDARSTAASFGSGGSSADLLATTNATATDRTMAEITDGFIAANDIAVYGGLLALATMDRHDLQTLVLDNARFRAFLELEPHVRRAITQFVNGRYAACLATIEAYRADYLLDLYLQRHVQPLYAEIRSKCIVNYLVPFSCVTLASLDAAFSTTGASIEDELATMIREGVVQVRLDSIGKLVRAVKVNPRQKMQREALAYTSSFEKDTLDRLRRMNIVASGLEVRGSGKIPDAIDMDDDSFDMDQPWSRPYPV